ncbi:MAG: hypothetical protein ACKPKO_02385, partial [Candidatus Fonsibacter sp.]
MTVPGLEAACSYGNALLFLVVLIGGRAVFENVMESPPELQRRLSELVALGHKTPSLSYILLRNCGGDDGAHMRG